MKKLSARKRDEPRVDGAYVSEFEQFLNSYKAAHPHVDDDQTKGRALLWDNLPVPAGSTVEPYGTDRIRQPAYVYGDDVDFGG